jgi:alanine dehydrogenase
MKIGIIATSQKKHERRLPLHPEHLPIVEPALLKQMVFEYGYGENFGVSDSQLATLSGGVAARDELLQESDLVILAKPEAVDAEKMKPGGILWGWVHCVQNPSIVQAAIARKLTYIAWETMNLWDASGKYQSHIFYRNNQIAGYAAIMHAVHLRGMDGHYGPGKKIVLINTGQVSTGALNALHSLGFSNITILTPQAREQIPSTFTAYSCYQLDTTDIGNLSAVDGQGQSRPVIDVLREADIIVNGILQNPLRPLMFVRPEDIDELKPNCLIVDVSCDAGMGFPFARPTNFDQPLLRVQEKYYYAVDHTPSFLWESATWEISQALLPYLSAVAKGSAPWKENSTLQKAVDILDGHILNQEILQFQQRDKSYPHSVCRASE